MERRYWPLLVIDEAGPAGLSPVQLQKVLFLIGQNLPHEVGKAYYNFVPYNYGPFDQHVYSDADSLIHSDLVQSVQVAGRSWAYYTITPQGHSIAQFVRNSELSPKMSQYITTVVKWVQSLSFAQLLSAIYKAYPQYKAKSVFVG
ncbi:MAG TPA: hypothetical protein VGJ37_19085 [Pyrinomonadaceae bacterium]|jgi:hypothetical protein